MANVPIVLGLEPPETLRGLDARKVVGLTTDPQRLALIRQERLKNYGGAGIIGVVRGPSTDPAGATV